MNQFSFGLFVEHLSEAALPLVAIVDSFVKRSLSPEEFERTYLRAFLDQGRQPLDDREYDILGELFFAVEDYCRYPAIRDETDLDEIELYNRACLALSRLKLLGHRN
ncbi:colicin immunity domain-containing protein [Bradymonas sediminis]|uniref:Colicin D immunity protein domain-containing protein n=1 Tax=Bradymonas sediminis TaxID=1548548 RepID=A0A2Z4FN80_9DELT|nr:colicin immunity domain-containing protein [Bradymonas sediminis]AWV90447.1 hypothetical protein DN745_14355 [Bradymonas sediminis]